MGPNVEGDLEGISLTRSQCRTKPWVCRFDRRHLGFSCRSMEIVFRKYVFSPTFFIWKTKPITDINLGQNLTGPPTHLLLWQTDSVDEQSHSSCELRRAGGGTSESLLPADLRSVINNLRPSPPRENTCRRSIRALVNYPARSGFGLFEMTGNKTGKDCLNCRNPGSSKANRV